ncbi:MAG: tRNA (N6-isopentenyl adenosine(37)-C2)-methylthiotransferase MiaB [Candidatus Aminicenantes bacterium]|nr:tRNA (N6-isopentenyl adenosine(37)-C2)-methylthiotransferase MiaB [Candidatus Aminicenantes bacterium]MBM3310929.1 tRNA (N6-isopentenyl adenosine(37)-C2)-methylthiotransferase MiaB [Candidatus Aminicenantes bacterium]
MSAPNPSLRGLRFALQTFGCQMNENDSERLAGLLIEAGAVPVEDESAADVVLVNTCAVRTKSEAKLDSYLGRLQALRRGRGLLVGVAGCVAQLRKERLSGPDGRADFVIGPDQYARVVDILAASRDRPVVATGRTRLWHEGGQFTAARNSPASAFVTIMEGCDNFCAYCVVPFVRGREKCRPLGSILDEVRGLFARGFLEIQLLGQNVNAYRDPETGVDFAGLLRRVSAVDRPAWVRFLTSHPKDFGPDIMAAMASSPRVCRQLHLPLQAGSDGVLERMRRGYSRADYFRLVRDIRGLMPEVALSTDIIVGFPGETEDEFKLTLAALEEARFANIFSFRYSPRPLTAASKLDDGVPAETKRRRLLEVQALQKRIQAELHAEFVGRVIRVLSTGQSRKDARVWAGRDEGHRVVNFRGERDSLGRFVEVAVQSAGPYSLRGDLLRVL